MVGERTVEGTSPPTTPDVPVDPTVPPGGCWTGVVVGTTMLLAALLGATAGFGAESRGDRIGDMRVSRVASESGSEDRSGAAASPVSRTVEQAQARFVESVNRLGVAHRHEDEARAEVDRITRLLREHDRPPHERWCGLWACAELAPEQQRANDEWTRANRELAKAESRLADRERVRGRREADSGQRWKDVERLTAQARAAAATEPTPTGPALIDLGALLADDGEDGDDGDDGDE